MITLDVNPSLSLCVDSGEKVISAEALNNDAKEILGGMELKGASLEVAVNAIIGSMMQKGYLGDMQNSILVSVENPDADRGKKLQEKVSQAIADAMRGGALDAAILTQNVSGDDKTLASLAAEYGISMGKAALIQEVIAQDSTLTFEDLSPMTINEIALIASSRNWPDGSVSQSGAASDKAYISREEALTLACTRAGVEVSDLLKYEIEFDSDDGVIIYEVEFETSEQKFECELDARTGSILDFETHNKGTQSGSGASGSTSGSSASGSSSESSTGSSARTSTGSSFIGEAAAKSAALSHAGVSEGNTYYIKCYLDYDSGKPSCYCVEFAAGSTEYEYEIDLYSGAVLNRKTGAHHSDSGSTSSTSSPAAGTGYIGEAAAFAKALSHAGVAESSLTEKRIELDEHKNVMVYEIEFETSSDEYEYQIDAISGAILEFKHETHH